MRKYQRIPLMLATVVAGISLVTVPVVAFAEGSATGSTPPASGTETPGGSNRPSGSGQGHNEGQGSTRFAGQKLALCQKREAKIQNIMSNIASRGQKQLDLFTTIAQRVENFYQTNDVAKGKTLSNYNDLLTKVTDAQTAAQTAVTTIQGTSVQFKCDGTDPKGAASSFKTALKSEIQALQAYRTSIKNLIVGVKSVSGTTASADNTTNTSPTSGGNQQ